jgi:hypothetical protein
MMFADSKHIQTHLVGSLHLLQEMLHTLLRRKSDPSDGVRDGGRKAVNAYLHHASWMR